MNHADRLERSFSALYRVLTNPGVARRVAFALLVIHTGLLAYSAYVHSPTLNEPGHLVAGLSNWKSGRFDLYRVNPPLVRMVAALPILMVSHQEDWSSFDGDATTRPESTVGEDFVAANGRRSYLLFAMARWACIPFSLIGAIVCYLWARDLYGRPSGIMAMSFWCVEPNILAHASLISTDVGSTSLGITASYVFWRWLKMPVWRLAVLAGIVLGLAELTKTTLLIFFLVWPLTWLVFRWSSRRSMTTRCWIREAGMLFLAMAIGIYILNVGYGFEGSFHRLGDFRFASKLFVGHAGVSPSSFQREPVEHHAIERPTSNRFARTWCGMVPVPVPKNYLLGIDLQQLDFENYGRPSYLRGEWREHGWWYYYLYAVAIKVPLGLWALAAIVLLCRFGCHLNHLLQGTAGQEVALILPCIALFVVASAKTGFSEHVRYVLPTFPYAFIWTSQIAQVFQKTVRVSEVDY